jgi:hypothetical protein
MPLPQTSASTVKPQQPPQPQSLDERAKKAGVDFNKAPSDQKVDDDQNPERLFSLRFKPYLTPQDLESVAETKKVDDENERRYAFNQTQEALLKVLFARAGHTNWKLQKPCVYNTRAVELWGRKIREPSYERLAAVELLAKRGRFPIKDYAIEKAVDLAEEAVINDFIDDQRKKAARHSIRELLPKDHHFTCNCNYTWDGKSKTCSGTSPNAKLAQVCWRTVDNFHFLEPKFEIYCPVPGETANG